VFGELDQVVDVRFGTLQASQHAHAEFHVVPRASHRVVTERQCHAIVADFVERTARRAVTVTSAVSPDTDEAPLLPAEADGAPT
jgi:hypothetical protein